MGNDLRGSGVSMWVRGYRWDGAVGVYLHVQGREALLHVDDSSGGRVVCTETCSVCV